MIFLSYISLSLAFSAVIALAVLFFKTYRDPRWRVFDFQSRLATESEVYNVSENPVIGDVKLIDRRTLRLSFLPPIQTDTWEIESVTTGIKKQGRYPDLTISGDLPQKETYRLTPKGRFFDRPLEITIDFYPAEKYAEAGLSWGDNYFAADSTIRFSTKPPQSTKAWTGITSSDLDILHARSILEDHIDFAQPTLDRLSSVFTLVMQDIGEASGTPSDALQTASPIETYELMKRGQKGWCENISLVYYLFANAADIPTRLVDIAGKFGPLKLTGHYVCESWIPEQASWCYVDPQSRVAHVTNADGRLLHTLDIKRLIDLDMLDTCRVLTFESKTNQLKNCDTGAFTEAIRSYLKGDIVLAYKFGYGGNLSYSRLRNFLFYPTLLLATFPIPRLYQVKQGLIYSALIFGVIGLLTGMWVLIDIPLLQLINNE